METLDSSTQFQCEACKDLICFDELKPIGCMCRWCFEECDSLDNRVAYARSANWPCLIIRYFWGWNLPEEIERTVPSDVLKELAELFDDLIEYPVPRYQERATEPLAKFIFDNIEGYTAWLVGGANK